MSFLSNNQRKRNRTILAGVLLLSLLAPLSRQATVTAAPSDVPAGFAASLFQEVWQRADGPITSGQISRSWLWGPGPGASTREPFAGSGDGTRLVQYFDKARMELNEAVTDPTSMWRVTTGLLVSEMVEGRVQISASRFTTLAPSNLVVAGDSNSSTNPRYSDFRNLLAVKAQDQTGQSIIDVLPGRKTSVTPPTDVRGAHFVSETSHNIPDVFWTFMNQQGPVQDPSGTIQAAALFDWLYVMGYPITEPYWVSLTIDGKQYPAMVQLFQRRVLTYVPAFTDGWRVQLGNVGQHYHEWRYNTASTQVPAPGQAHSAPPALLPASGSFAGISGDSFVYAGAEVKLKGTNYWLSRAPFVGTWSEWNGPQIKAELDKARQLGVNTVRIGIPYDHRDTMDVVWNNDKSMTKVHSWIKNQMTQFLQITSTYGMKVIFVLFEWNDKYPTVGTQAERSNIAYLEGIIGTFKNDDRVLAWDLHNEPDYYEEWKGGKQNEVIDWLKRMATYTRNIDQRHPITVGVGDYQSLWYPATDGTTILSIVDFASFHCYNAGALTTQIEAIKAHTDKPILLEEMGWPSSTGDEAPRPGATFDEPTQNFLYKSMLGDVKSADIAGVMQWTLMDYSGGQTGLIPGFERNFGLVRADSTFKPSAEIFRNDYSARIMPSDTRTEVPLDTSDRPNGRR